MVRSDNKYGFPNATRLVPKILSRSLTLVIALAFLTLTNAPAELAVVRVASADIRLPPFSKAAMSTDTNVHTQVSGFADREPAWHKLSLAGCAKTMPASLNSQTRSATQWINDPQNKGKIRWLSGVIVEQEARLNPMKSAPLRLPSAPVSTYNSLIPRTTELLKTMGFGFDIPTAANITGIEVHIETRRSRLGHVEDTEVKLIKDGVIAGRNQAASGQWPSDRHISTYGSPSDRWDLVLTALDVNSPDFGIAIAVLLTPFDNFQTAEIDSVAITVHWR